MLLIRGLLFTLFFFPHVSFSSSYIVQLRGATNEAGIRKILKRLHGEIIKDREKIPRPYTVKNRQRLYYLLGKEDFVGMMLAGKYKPRECVKIRNQILTHDNPRAKSREEFSPAALDSLKILNAFCKFP